MGIEDTLIQLRMTSKQLENLAKKAQKQSGTEKERVKKAITDRNVEGAQIYAENAIRKKNEYLNYLRLASRVDAVSSRVKSAMAMQGVAKQMGLVTRGLESAMASLDLEKVSKIMEQFEKQFTDLDVKSNVMESSMSSATTLSTPQNEVDALIKLVAEENNLDLIGKMADAPSVSGLSIGATGNASRSNEQEDELTKRLAKIRN